MEDRNAHISDQMVTMDRRLYTQEAFDRTYPLETRKDVSLLKRLRQTCQCSRKTPWKLVSTYIPVVKFFRTYKVREYLLGDFLSGLTVSFLHLPQAMGFGILASLRPEHGLYTTFFPVLLYLIFGTSPHISFGTNAVMALLTETVVDREANAFISTFPGGTGNVSLGNSSIPTGPTEDAIMDVKVKTAAACCLLTGLILTAMGLLRFGFLTTYMSDSFIGGFTTAAAIHICTSQVPKLFGIKVKSFSGAGKLVLTYIELFRNLGQTVVAEVIIGVLSLATLLLVKVCINERYSAKMKMPIPIDLIVVIVATFISHFAKFPGAFSVAVVGPIPSGFSAPFVPSLSNAGGLVADAAIMAILSLAMSISMAKLMSKKHGVQINDNQEMVAYGAANLVSSFFSCFPSATAPPRTMILSSLGARTTLNGLPTCIFMLLVILVIGQLFVTLPLSVLAAMIIVSMKNLLLQYRNLPMIWKVNKYDFMIWIVTNLVGVLVDLNYGLFAGIGISVILIIVQTQLSSGYLLGRGQSEPLLLDSNRSKTVELPEGVKIFRFNASLYFATAERFKSQLFKKTVNPQEVKKQLRKKRKQLTNGTDGSEPVDHPEGYVTDDDQESQGLHVLTEDARGGMSVLIIDCSAMNYIDIGGKNMLLQMVKDFKEVNIEVRLAGMPDQGRAVLEAAGFFDSFQRDLLFLDIYDAVQHANNDTIC